MVLIVSFMTKLIFFTLSSSFFAIKIGAKVPKQKSTYTRNKHWFQNCLYILHNFIFVFLTSYHSCHVNSTPISRRHIISNCNFIKGKNVPQLYFKEYEINGDFFIAIVVFVIFRAWDSIRAIKRFKKNKIRCTVGMYWSASFAFFVCFSLSLPFSLVCKTFVQIFSFN